MIRGTPEPDFKIEKGLVHALLKEQHPDLAYLPLRFEQEGWDNVLFRLGDQWAVRLPRREAAATLILNEQTWLPMLAGHLPLTVPIPDRVGMPGLGYPWRWSILPWIPGNPADEEEPGIDQAAVYAAFLKALHTDAPSNAPPNPVRGVPLQQRAAATEERMQRLEDTTDPIPEKIMDCWNLSLNTPIDVKGKWIHGDLHARNVLVQNGRITGIIDWGDITSGDIATDLASIWMIFPDPGSRRKLLSAYGNLSAETLQRARGWAILFATFLLDTGLVDNPRNAEMGRRAIQRILQDT